MNIAVQESVSFLGIVSFLDFYEFEKKNNVIFRYAVRLASSNFQAQILRRNWLYLLVNEEENLQFL
jgi:hypothetical protein